MDKKSFWLRPNSSSSRSRAVCAAVGIVVAAGLYYSGYAPAEPTTLSGVAYAAAGAAVGVLVYGIYDFIRKVM